MTDLTHPGIHMARLRELLDGQRAAYRADPYPTAKQRRDSLKRLEQMLRDNEQAICDAISEDFGHRSQSESRLLEFFPSLSALKHAREHVSSWMAPERRPVALWFQPGSARIIKQPLGVVGIIVPWNYPLYLAVSPMVSALSAGNRVMVKMSEFTPRFSDLFAELAAKYFTPDQVVVVTGNADVGRTFSELPFDHLLFTGSTAVGKHIMHAAAENLTPVTLELGGKSPAVVAPGFSTSVAAERILLGKSLNAGQTCIAPDYVLLPRSEVGSFIKFAEAEFGRMYPNFPLTGDYTSVINDRHFARLQGYLADARTKGAGVHPLSASADEATRKMPVTLVTDVNDSMTIMQDEIFGPLLPIVTYENFDQALSYVNDRPRPLAFYLFDNDDARIDEVLHTTIAGGVTINDTILHIGQEELPFGGVGPSGMGHYHGSAGFDTFSKLKSVYYQTRINALPLLKPPFGPVFDKLVKLMTR